MFGVAAEDGRDGHPAAEDGGNGHPVLAVSLSPETLVELDRRVADALMDQEERLHAYFEKWMYHNAGLMKQMRGKVDTYIRENSGQSENHLRDAIAQNPPMVFMSDKSLEATDLHANHIGKADQAGANSTSNESGTTTIYAYLPKELEGVSVLVEDTSNRWRATNTDLDAKEPGLGYRASKRHDDRIPWGILRWGEILEEAVDAGDGWVRFPVRFPVTVDNASSSAGVTTADIGLEIVQDFKTPHNAQISSQLAPIAQISSQLAPISLETTDMDLTRESTACSEPRKSVSSMNTNEHASTYMKHSGMPHHEVGEEQQEEINKILRASEAKAMEDDFFDEDEVDTRPFGERFVSSRPFEMVFAVLIVLNTFNMCAEAEYRGWDTGHSIGVAGSEAKTDGGDTLFLILEMMFTIAFTIEVVLKLFVLRWKFWKSSWNVFDFIIIAFAWFSMVVELNLPLNPMVLRLVRLVRLLRMLETLRQYEVFDTLFLMVRGIRASATVLVWVMVLIFPMLACCALAMNYTIEDFIKDETKPSVDRYEAYDYFGTFTKAMLSMFEVTFANWVPICRFLWLKVDEKWALFFMGYKLVVGIAVMRIIYGVFLHTTFACAASDDQALIQKKNRETKKYQRQILALFSRMDRRSKAGSTGELSRDDFFDILHKDHHVKTLLSALELDVHDAELVFELTDDGDGSLTAEEMVYGFSRLKGSARSLDILALTDLTKEATTKIDQLLEKFSIAM